MSLSSASLAVSLSSAILPHASRSHLEASTVSDTSLLRLIQQRDDVAMATLFERHARLVYSVAVRILRDPAQAEDVLQEIFMQVWTKPITLDAERGSLRTLLAVMARNRSVDFIRQRKHTQSTDDFDMPSSFNLESDSERRLLLHRVREVARTLPPEQQSVLELTYFEGLTNVEIAIQTGTPLGTVKARIRSALVSLERTLARTALGEAQQTSVNARFVKASRAKLQALRAHDMPMTIVELVA